MNILRKYEGETECFIASSYTCNGVLAGATATLLMLADCSGSGGVTAGKDRIGAEADPSKPKTVDMPQTLTLLNDDGACDELMVELVSKKYPNTKLQVIKVKDSNPEELVASGSFPDLMFASATWFQRRFLPLEVQYDLSESIKRHQMDLSQYESYMINDIRKMGKGSMIALPYYADFSGVTYYNKDIFDLLAVPYPKDGMYWEDYYNLSRQPTRMKKKAFVLGISSTSKQKEAAFEVLSFLVSEEAQTYISKNAYVPAMTSTAVRSVFGESVPTLKGKNTKAITTVKPFPDEEVSVYDDFGQTQLAKVYTGVLEGTKDINTVLRENNELLDETIRREKNK